MKNSLETLLYLGMFAESLRWDVSVRRHIASLIKQKER